LLNYSIYNELN